MQENKRNKETSLFKKPQGFRTVRIHFTAEAIEWLGGTTKDDDGNTIGNHTLFYDLLSRMRLSPGRGDSFRRPQELQPGQFQFSETRLAEEWNIGRKRIRNLLATMEKLGMIAVDASKTASGDHLCRQLILTLLILWKKIIWRFHGMTTPMMTVMC